MTMNASGLSQLLRQRLRLLLLVLTFRLLLFQHDEIVVLAADDDNDDNADEKTSTATSTTGTTVSTCQSSIDCHNDGMCLKGDDNYHDGITPTHHHQQQQRHYCSCLPGVSGGTWCEDTKCNLPCLNGGSCRHSYHKSTGLSSQNDTTLTYVCECIKGYKGVLCEIPPSSSSSSTASSTTATAVATTTTTAAPSSEASPASSNTTTTTTTSTDSGSGNSNPNHVQQVDGWDYHHTEGGQMFDAIIENNNNNNKQQHRCRHDTLSSSSSSSTSNECQNGGICVLSMDGNYCQCPHGTAGDHCEERFDVVTTTTTTTTTNSTDDSAESSAAPSPSLGTTTTTTTTTESPFNSSTSTTTTTNNGDDDGCPTQCPPGTVCVPSQYEFSEGRVETVYKCIVDDNGGGSSSGGSSGSSSGTSQSQLGGGSNGVDVVESVGLAIILIIAVTTSVTFFGVWMFRRFQIRSKSRSKPTNDIEMTGDGIGIQLSKSEDTADNSTDGDWVNDNRASSSSWPIPPPQYATEVRSSWHEMMEQAELELSEEANNNNNNTSSNEDNNNINNTTSNKKSA